MTKKINRTLTARAERVRLAHGTTARARLRWLAAGLAGVLALAVTSVASAQTPPNADSKRVAESLATNLCVTCHGPGGVGDQPKIPRIGGQQRDYLEAQLKAFRMRSRNDPDAHENMWAIAATLNDNVVAGLADYFSSQPAGRGKFAGRDAAVMAKGEKLFHRGDSARGIAACAVCHGQNGEGMSVFPRLAGQHAYYLGTQMEAIQAKLRTSPVMHGIIKELTPEERQALSYYLESL